MQQQLLIGGYDGGQVAINPRYANRHGLIAGATGTGKTVTLQGLAEGFSDIGVPVFMADVKGDLAGLSQPGQPHPKIDERVSRIGIEGFALRGFPVALWDVSASRAPRYGPRVSEMGPQLLSRLLDLNEAQESVLAVVFEFCDDEGMLLLDLKDLRTALEYIAEHSADMGGRVQRHQGIGQRYPAAAVAAGAGGRRCVFGEPRCNCRISSSWAATGAV